LFFWHIRATIYEYVTDRCTNSAKKDYKICRFPWDPERRKIWAKNTRQDWTPSDNSMLCKISKNLLLWFFYINKMLNDVYYFKYVLMSQMYSCHGINDASDLRFIYTY